MPSQKTLILFHCTVYWPIQFSLVQSYIQLCDSMDCSTPSCPVYHQLPELAQTHVSHVGDANQPSLPLVSPSPPDFSPSSIRVFSSESVLCIRWPKYQSFSFRAVLRMNIQAWFPLRLTDLISLQSKGLSRVFNTTGQNDQLLGAQPFL